MIIEAKSLSLKRYPPRASLRGRAAFPAASMPASMAALARATAPPISPKTAPAWRRRSASSRIVCSPPTRSTRRKRRGRRGCRGPPTSAPAPTRIVTRTVGLAIGVTTADCGPILFADPPAARHRRGPCRLARGACRHCRGNGRSDGAAGRRAQPDPRRPRPDDPPAQLRSRRRSHRPFRRRGSGQRRVLSARTARGPCPVRSRRLSSRRGSRAPTSAISRISGCAPTPIRTAFSASGARPTAPSRITAAT